jgi:hypothetical protein
VAVTEWEELRDAHMVWEGMEDREAIRMVFRLFLGVRHFEQFHYYQWNFLPRIWPLILQEMQDRQFCLKCFNE